MKIVLIDNFDSFTYNITQAYQHLGENIQVVRNHVDLNQIIEIGPDLLIIGPGPGRPKNAGISKDLVLLGIPLFGICLGHQVIGEVFGASVVRASQVMHGKSSRIFHNASGVFKNLPQGFVATRYHSLVIAPQSLPLSLEITAWTQSGEIMGISHRKLPIKGVQFHPESIASEEGLHLLRNSLLL
jgi:anthranilate synthase component II